MGDLMSWLLSRATEEWLVLYISPGGNDSVSTMLCTHFDYAHVGDIIRAAQPITSSEMCPRTRRHFCSFCVSPG